MCNTRNNGSSGCGNPSPCNRHGERILVNQIGCGNTSRRRCSCVNTYRPGNRCERDDMCGCRPSRPCPPKARPCCEDQCHTKHHSCMKNCHRQEGCHDRYESDFGYDRRGMYREDGYDYQNDYED